MKTILHKEETRGSASHGWLNAKHTFSFGSYHNPKRVNFGALRVLNDDVIAAAMGFGKHPHDNMEIITIPLQGVLEHQDSMGNISEIKPGEIQVMSAGTGIFHSERNKSKTEELKLLQIWVIPNERNIVPRYAELNLSNTPNTLHQIISPNEADGVLSIQQDSWFHLGEFKKEFTFTHELKKEGNGVYVFVIEGEFYVENTLLQKRDGLGIWDTINFSLKANSNNAKILLIEVPMEI